MGVVGGDAGAFRQPGRLAGRRGDEPAAKARAAAQRMAPHPVRAAAWMWRHAGQSQSNQRISHPLNQHL